VYRIPYIEIEREGKKKWDPVQIKYRKRDKKVVGVQKEWLTVN
jgi:hypothetical protein